VLNTETIYAKIYNIKNNIAQPMGEKIHLILPFSRYYLKHIHG